MQLVWLFPLCILFLCRDTSEVHNLLMGQYKVGFNFLFFLILNTRSSLADLVQTGWRRVFSLLTALKSGSCTVSLQPWHLRQWVFMAVGYVFQIHAGTENTKASSVELFSFTVKCWRSNDRRVAFCCYSVIATSCYHHSSFPPSLLVLVWDLQRIMMVFLSCWFLAISVLKELKRKVHVLPFSSTAVGSSGVMLWEGMTPLLSKKDCFFPAQFFSLFWCQRSFFALENYLTS